ncbi:universal stress protein [Natrialbaceae archaeon A-CW3]
MYRRILCPTDGDAPDATEHAIAVAERDDAELHLLYVVDSDVYAAYGGDEYVHESEGLEAALEHRGVDTLEAAAEQASEAGVETVREIHHGIPHEAILEYADDADVDLLVMGSKARSGEYRRLLGSVTDRVVRLADRPVTVVKTPVESGE